MAQLGERPTLPARANPLAKAIGGRCKVVRRGRKLTRDEAAKELGVPLMHYIYVETGRQVPDPILANRIYNWMLLGVTYEGSPLAQAKRAATIRSRDQERTLKVTLPTEIVDRLAREADRLGMTQDTMAELFITRGLDNRPALVMLDEAVDAINKAKMSQAMRESPEIRDILMADLRYAVKAGVEMKAAKQVKQAPAERLATLTDFETIEPLEE